MIKRPHLVMKPKEEDKGFRAPSGAIFSEIYCPYCGKKHPAHIEGQSFDFFCPYCGHANRAREEEVGGEKTCESCGDLITVPSPPGHPAKTSRIFPETTFKFFCIYCGQKLSARETMAGQTSLCPTCQRQLIVPEVEIE